MLVYRALPARSHDFPAEAFLDKLQELSLDLFEASIADIGLHILGMLVSAL